MLGKPSRFSCAALVAAILSCALAPSAAINYNHVCALVPDNSYIASNDASNVYYSCNNGVATQQQCASGMSFSVDQQQCVSTSVTPQGNTCAGLPIGSWAPVPGSCQSFYYCSATGPEMSSCPGNQNFDAANQMCDFIPCNEQDTSSESNGSSTTSTATVNLCSLIQSGIVFGNTMSCSGWSMCQNGVLRSSFCRAPYLYNPNLQLCDYASDVTCIQVTNDPELIPSPTSYSGSCTNTTNVPNVCNAYLNCTNGNYALLYCPAGEYYDTVSQTCVARMEARNDCDRCQGTTSTFVNAYSATNCTGYLYCQNGVQQASGNCTNGAFFDEVLGGCAVETDPLYGCCNPAYWSSSSGAGNSTVPNGSSNSTSVDNSSGSTGTNGTVLPDSSTTSSTLA